MREQLWQTQDNSNAAYLIPPIAHLARGPAAWRTTPAPGCPIEYNDHFFECDFRGGFTGSGVHTFTMKPEGRGLQTDRPARISSGTPSPPTSSLARRRHVHHATGSKGWHVTGNGRIYHVFDPEAMKDPIVEEVKDLLAAGFEKRSKLTS